MQKAMLEWSLTMEETDTSGRREGRTLENSNTRRIERFDNVNEIRGIVLSEEKEISVHV